MFASNTSQVSSAANYIEDVFSTYLYTGNSSTQTITNGIDLSGKGGLVWIKSRSGAYFHNLMDTTRGMGYLLESNTTAAQQGPGGYTTALSTGFSINVDYNGFNASGQTYASWTFRKQEKFFDVVTWTGNGTNNRQISHALGSTPGCIIVKELNQTGSWYVYHRSNGTGKYMMLNSVDGVTTAAAYFPSVSSTTFTPTSDTQLNTSSVTYVAYLFAHNAGGFGASGNDNVISCGYFDGTGFEQSINLGWEPQWLLTKRYDNTGGWILVDTMRGQTADYRGSYIYPNNSNAESVGGSGFSITPTGFNTNASSNYIYIAIRRGPMKVPTSGTSVFTPVTATAANNLSVTAGFPPDLAFIENRVDGVTRNVTDRLRGGTTTSIISLESASTGAEQTYSGNGISFNSNSTGIIDNFTNFNQGASSMVYWMMRRAPSFMDVVCYTGTGATLSVSHNLGVVPELMIVRVRNKTTPENWCVYSQTLGAGYFLALNSTAAKNGSFDSTRFPVAPTSSVFTVGSDQDNGGAFNYVAYLFASCPGVSKVGSYTGTGTTKQVDCGFAAGARFVLIKRTDSTGDWYVWDSARGIVSGNDPYLLLNSTAAEVTSTDYIDTYSAGFEISSTAPAAINASGGTYIFLAIA